MRHAGTRCRSIGAPACTLLWMIVAGAPVMAQTMDIY